MQPSAPRSPEPRIHKETNGPAVADLSAPAAPVLQQKKKKHQYIRKSLRSDLRRLGAKDVINKTTPELLK
jgi:hypothetical protein